MSKHLQLILIGAALTLLPLSYALGQTQAEGERAATEGTITLEQKLAKAPKIDLRQQVESQAYEAVKDGQAFTCVPNLEDNGGVYFFMTGRYCQGLCSNGDPVYFPEWPPDSGSGRSLCHCPEKNKTWIY